MRAAIFHEFQGPIRVGSVADPEPHDDAVIVAVAACGICRSDWHAWMGHDPGVRPPHVPGHELAGTVARVGAAVGKWRGGERVTAPFCCGCGDCPDCRRGDTHVCDRQTQPGFTHCGGFADFVEVRHADTNLVALPPAVDAVTAASLGCRFATAHRAIVAQGRVAAGDWVAVHGCGGVGLSAVMVAVAFGARAVAVDPSPARRRLAVELGAEEAIDPGAVDVPAVIRKVTGHGAHVSIDAFGSGRACRDSILSLANRGRHVQVGLLFGGDATPHVPMDLVIAKELEILGGHGMPASGYGPLLALVAAGRLDPARLVSDVVGLADGAATLERFGEFPNHGMTVIDMTAT